ncbi:MAG: hypothetical protein IPK50_19475 [Fibrobacterota bacterium]|nr:MAG: hypothetical protein IPK50_19475 [Fibrobacterota bacterium]
MSEQKMSIEDREGKMIQARSKLIYSLEIFQSEDDYDDLPERGFADFEGRPYFMAFNQERSEFPLRLIYGMSEISQEILEQVVEIQKIWHQWELDYHGGFVDLATHPFQLGVKPTCKSLYDQVEQSVASLTPEFFIQATFHTSEEWLAAMAQHAGKRWPIPGSYSRDIEIVWGDRQ